MVFQLTRCYAISMTKSSQKYFIIGLIVCIVFPGCSSLRANTGISPDITPTWTPAEIETQTTPDPIPSFGVVYQYAIGGEGSSEFSDPEWSAEQVIGEPDSPGCGDYQFSWASAASDSIDTLTVHFSTLVFPLKIIIHESFNPDQVVKVEIQDPESGGFYTVLQKNPTQVDRPCPYQLEVPVEGIGFKTNTVRLTVDQSQLGLGWNEIDAVQLIGTLTQQ